MLLKAKRAELEVYCYGQREARRKKQGLVGVSVET